MAIFSTWLESTNPTTSTTESTIVSTFEINEGYNSGWNGTATLTPRTATALDISDLIVASYQQGFRTGSLKNLKLRTTTTGTNPQEVVVRTWPCIVSKITPKRSVRRGRPPSLELELVDPVTFLHERPIWAVFKGFTIATAIGGAIAMAGGAEGRPTLNPILTSFPAINIVDLLRESTREVPYVIAPGVTLGEWLADVQSLMGIRVEMIGNEDNSITVVLTDRLPGGNQLMMESSVDGLVDVEKPKPSWSFFYHINYSKSGQKSSSNCTGQCFLWGSAYSRRKYFDWILLPHSPIWIGKKLSLEEKIIKKII